MIKVMVESVRSDGWELCDYCHDKFVVGNHAILVEKSPTDGMTLHVGCAVKLAHEMELKAGTQ